MERDFTAIQGTWRHDKFSIFVEKCILLFTQIHSKKLQLQHKFRESPKAKLLLYFEAGISELIQGQEKILSLSKHLCLAG